MPNKHSTDLVGWHAADGIKAWIKAEAERRGVTQKAILDEALTAHMEAQAEGSHVACPVSGLGAEPGESSAHELGCP